MDDFVCVKIAVEHGLPNLDWEGWVPERLTKGVHVRVKPCVLESSGDPTDVVGLDIRTSAPRHLVALARFRRASEIVRFVESKPKSMVETDLVCSLRETLAVDVVVEFI